MPLSKSEGGVGGGGGGASRLSLFPPKHILVM